MLNMHHRHRDGLTADVALAISRQAELVISALDHRPALRDVVDEHVSEVAVLWSPPASPSPLEQSDADLAESLGALLDGPGRAYIDDLTALLGIAQV